MGSESKLRRKAPDTPRSVASDRRQRSLVALAGSGKGLWGKDSSKTLRGLRNEWQHVPSGRSPRSRANILKRVAGACERALARVGVRAHVVGSLAYDDVREGSDLDLLIVSYPGKTWGQVRSAVDDAARPYGVPVDVIFADTLPPAVRKAMLQDAQPSRARAGKKR